VGATNRMAAFVHNERQVGRPENSQRVYEPKITEFELFCDHVYPHCQFRYNMDGEKFYKFLFWTAFREQKKRGGKKTDKPPVFDADAYDEVCASFSNGSVVVNYPNPTKPVCESTFVQYKAVLKSIHVEQRSLGVCNLSWDLIWTLDCANLQKHVKERLPALKKANFVEKMDGEFAPYAIVERYDEIEALLWEDSRKSTNRRCIAANIRHRACTLLLSTGILRSDSVHHCEISDFFSLRPPKLDKDVHEIWLLMMGIPVGKTTHGKKQYGRATRHKNVLLCCCGAISLYLNYRISHSHEFQDMTVDEWLDNSHWFSIKFLVDVNGSDYSREMKSDGYSDHIKSVLKRLNLPFNKLLKKPFELY
jgi:Centromere DNA-binding protein complex CBF3 subunit, domain 2